MFTYLLTYRRWTTEIYIGMFQRWATDTYMAVEEVCSNGVLQIPTWLQKRYGPTVDYRYLHGYRRGMFHRWATDTYMATEEVYMFQRWATDTYMAIEKVCSNGGLQIPTWLQKKYGPTVDYRYLHGYRRGTFHQWVQ